MVRGLLSGLLAEGQEEVRAQWLRKVHLQVRPHEQLEDIVANWLRRNKEDRETGEGRQAREMEGKQKEVGGTGGLRNEKARR